MPDMPAGGTPPKPRVSPDNAELKNPTALREAQDTLEACGVKLVQDATLGAKDIKVDPPAPKK
jgi:hypothetical protein